MSAGADPFGTAALREATLQAWRSSPTRLREDTATERDLIRGGYRDRVITELAQNAADAASKANVPGRLDIWMDNGELHVANTGAPLDLAGVQALTALRASSKDATAVGRYGVGFTAVAAVSDTVQIRSVTGSIEFSRARTRAAVGADEVPMLRLAWSVDAVPVSWAASEVVIRLDGAFEIGDVSELLLELPALHEIRVDGQVFVRTERELGAGLAEVTIAAGIEGNAPAHGGTVPGDGAEPANRAVWWQFRTPTARWLLPAAGQLAPDVLRAPTRSDEHLSLPAMLIADVAMQPDRRRLLPGVHVAGLAKGYADFARALDDSQRLRLVPAPGFARSEVDALLREAILAELREHAWLPTVAGRDAIPLRANVFGGLTDELAEVLAEVVDALVLPALSGPRHAAALAQLDVHRLGLARIAELLAGVDREPAWWGRLYDALEPFVVDAVAAEELGSLPVPLADGRLVTGPRTTVSGSDITVDAPVSWARLVHPDAVRPLLARLGAHPATALDLLTDPALEAALEDGEDVLDPVLALAGIVGSTAQLPSWLGLLELPDDTGAYRPADELLLPDAPLAAVLDESPFGTVDPELVDDYGSAALRAVGVGWGFTLAHDPAPTGPPADLDAAQRWWDQLDSDPESLVAVRDLDLVAEDRWPQAIALLTADPQLRTALADRDGYSAWWLRRHATIAGVPLGGHRSAGDETFAGLLDELPYAPALLADARDIDTELAQVLLERLADDTRRPAPAVIARTHRLLAAAPLDVEQLALPDAVRTVDGTLADPADALVVDKAWLVSVIPLHRTVVGDLDSAGALATLLDLPLASEVVESEVVGSGRRTLWSTEPALVLAGLAFDLSGADVVEVHDDLEVRLAGALTGTHRVPWWTDAAGVVHVRAGFGLE